MVGNIFYIKNNIMGENNTWFMGSLLIKFLQNEHA